jgi:putative selenium metabolism hydrolase
MFCGAAGEALNPAEHPFNNLSALRAQIWTEPNLKHRSGKLCLKGKEKEMGDANTIDALKEISEALYPRMIDFCQRIIRVPSLSGDEGAVSELYMAEMKALGYDEVFQDDWGNVAGIVRGTEAGPTIMYNGHMDVVAAGSAEDWGGYDPFGADIDECPVFDRECEQEDVTEVIHGRGASDMKCGGAAQMYAGAVLIELKKRGFRWKGAFLLAAVVLEENGEMMGTIKLTEGELPARGIEIDGMVCAEPSSLRLVLGHRGRMELRVTVYGRNCHGSSPWLGINAAEKAAKLIVEVNRRIAVNFKEDPRLGRSGIALTILENEPNALCIVPDKCTVIYDRRLVPRETTASAIAEIQAILDDLSAEDPDFRATVEINANVRTSWTGKAERIESQKEAWIIDPDHPFVKACAEGLQDAGEEVHYGYWAFSTDIPQIGVRMKKPAIGYSGGQEYYIHNPIELVRLDYLKRSLIGNVSMYLKLSELPEGSFTTEWSL